VLYVTQSAGFKHDVLPLSEQIVKQLGEKGGFDVTVTQDASTITGKALEACAGVVFCTAR
jgi:hypothetical protein